ncbi:MAG: glycosyltransferase [Saprospirales bacterium]|nr:MAG: glycosyltransferase [Saprospirales bacterium]
MKCWLASFPRSGNTFFRNILFYVYGLESSTWHKESDYPVDENYSEFPFVKTHLLPDDLYPSDPSIPAIYLVRDGRDAMVSIAHHRSDIVNPGSNLYDNLKEAIVAAEGSFFGGWSINALKWIERADLVIRYEDLIRDPQAQFRRVESLIDMPKAQWDQLPNFKSMKYGKPKYGGQTTSKSIKISAEEFSKKFFRKGKSGTWKEDMPDELLGLFWRKHGEVMDRLGYADHTFSVGQNPLLDGLVMDKMGLIADKTLKTPKYRILIEANKLQISRNDGIKRYLTHLLKGLQEVSKYGNGQFRFDLLINKKIEPLDRFEFYANNLVKEVKAYEKVLLGIKAIIRFLTPGFIYEPLASFYRDTPVRSLLRKARSGVGKREEDALVRKFSGQVPLYDLIHLPLPQNFHYIEKLQGSLIVTIHDLTHKVRPEFHTDDNVRRTEKGITESVKSADHFIAISKFTQQDFIRYYPIPENKVSLVYEASDAQLFFPNFNSTLTNEVRERYLLPEGSFFLCLSTIEPRKNLINTIRGFIQFKQNNPGLQASLVIAGDKGWKTMPILKEAENHGAEIHFTGFVEDRDLHVLFSEAVAFIYLSFYEGFGLPPLEAMSCMTAVLHSNITSLKEVVGDSGLIADPDSPDDIALKMGELFFDEQLRSHLEQKAFNRALQFNFRRTLLNTMEVYKNCLK